MAYNIKAALRAAKNIQYEPIEVKVREATNNDPWGVSTSAMSDIARATHHHDEYALLFKMVWKRLNDHEHVMHVQKALILIDYLLRNGAERFLTDAKRRARDISALQKYKQYDANNRDVGGDVRSKAKAVYELLTNESKLAEERAKAKSIRDVKLSGMSSDGFGSGRSSHAAGAREFDEDRYNAESPRNNDWEKDSSPAPVKRKEPKAQSKADADEDEDDDEPEEDKEAVVDDDEGKKKKKKSKSVVADGPAVEEGEKKKKKKKKRAAESADTTAPPSAETTAPTTPSFNAAPVPSNDFGSFDAFGSNDGFGSVTSSAVASPVAPVSTITMSAPTAADKPKKSRKKKESTITASEPVQQQPALSVTSNGDFDLSNFASVPTPRGEVDMLTGMHSSAPLEDMFAHSSLMDGPMDGPAEEDGFAMDEPALLDQPHYDDHISPRANGNNAPTSPINKDVWDLASNFTNIDNIQSNAPAKPKAVNPQETVSMSMMRSMQPFGSSSVSSASTPAQPAGFGAFGPPSGGMQNGFGMQQQPHQQQAFGGFGMQQQPMQQGFGFGMQQQPQQPMQQPFGGMPGGFGAPQGFGAPPMPMESDLPFAAQSINQKRPGANGKPVIFDVQQARPQPTMQQTSNAPTGPRWR